jgi:hypothetical protein
MSISAIRSESKDEEEGEDEDEFQFVSRPALSSGKRVSAAPQGGHFLAAEPAKKRSRLCE